MSGTVAAYGTLTVAVLALSLWSRCPGTRMASAWIFLAWIAYNSVRDIYLISDLAPMMGHMDIFGCMVGLMLWFHRPSYWRATFALAYFLQALIHLGFMLPMDYDGFQFSYYLSLNILFLVQLASIAWPSLAYARRRMKRRALDRASRVGADVQA